MKIPSRLYLWIFPVALLAVAGLVWNRPKPVSAQEGFGLDDVRGRYIAAENAYDVSSVHSFSAAANSSNVGPAINFETAEVLQADGKGFVCGEADGFYALGTAGAIPGTNLGPSFYHGTYTVDANGRVVITTCSDTGTPTLICTVAGGFGTPCAPFTKEQVGYIQGEHGNKIVTVEQVFGNPNLSPGFLAHKRTWTKKSKSED